MTPFSLPANFIAIIWPHKAGTESKRKADAREKQGECDSQGERYSGVTDRVRKYPDSSWPGGQRGKNDTLRLIFRYRGHDEPSE